MSLERLSRKAASESLRALGAHLDEDDRFDALAVHLLGVGVRAWGEHDVERAGGVSRETFAFRRMRGWRSGSFTNGPTIDWIRSTVCDSRFEPTSSTSVTASGEVPEVEVLDGRDFDAAVLEASAGLSTPALWALHHVARPRAEGLPLRVVADRLGMSVGETRARLERLRDELGMPARAWELAADLSRVDLDATRVGWAA